MKTIEWKPNSKPQATFMGLPFDIFEGLYGGAAGGGKTEAIVMLPLVLGFHNYPKYTGISFRRTFPQLERSLIKRAKEIYPATGASYNSNDHVFTWKNGARHFFGYMETDDDARQYDTDEYNLACFEELAHFTKYQYLYFTATRVRTSTNLPAIARSAATPGNIGHKWVKERFIDPAPNGYKRLKDPLGNERIFIPAKATDNPDLIRNNPNYLNQLRMLSIAEQRAKIEGDWNAFEGQVFTEFRINPFPGEPENAKHVIEPFNIPAWWPKVIAIDWGYGHKTCVLWAAISEEGKAFVYREYTARKTKIRHWAAEIERLSQFDENIVGIVIDPSAKGDRGTDHTVYDQFVEATQWHQTKSADNDRIGGKLLLHEYLRWEKRPPRYIPAEGYNRDRALYIYRMFGEQAYNDYEALFLPEPEETNLPKLQIFNTCKELIAVIPQCVPDEKRPEDVQKFNGDDAYDTVRYLLKEIDRYIDMSAEEYAKRSSLTRILNEYSLTRDETAFYRKMELYETKNRSTNRAVQRDDLSGYIIH